jgi:uncharacterized repeat protein (TIGR01451 family)
VGLKNSVWVWLVRLQHGSLAYAAKFALLFLFLLVCLVCNSASAHTITSKTTPTPTVVVGGVVTYQLMVSSAGQSSVSTGMTTVDYLPPGFAYRSTVGVQLFNGATYTAATTPTPGSTQPQWGLFGNPNNSSAGGPVSSYTITFEADVVNPICGQTIPNSADTLGGSQHAVLIPATNQAPAIVTGPPPSLTVNKTTSTPVLLNSGAGLQALYRIVVSNAGNLCAATGVNITDALPTGFTYASTTGFSYTGAPAAASRAGGADPAVGANNLAWTGFTIPAGGSVTIDFVANIAAGTANSTYNNSAAASTTQAGAAVNNFGPGAPVQLVPALLTKSFAPTVMQVGTSSTLTFTLSKPTATALSGLNFTDNLPTNLVVSGSPASPQCGGTVSGSGGAVTATGASLGAGVGSCVITVPVTSSLTGSYTNNAANFTNVSPILVTAGANANLIVSNSALTKSFITPLVGVGSTSVLRFTMTTPAGGAAHSGMSFTDTLPAGVAVVPGFTAAQCNGTLSSSGAQNITFTNGSLGAGPASCNIDITVRGLNSGVYPNDTSRISGLGGGLTAFTTNSTLTVRGTVLEKSFSPASMGMGGTSILTFNLTNGLGSPAQSGLTFTDTLPAGVTLAAVPITSQCGGSVSGTLGGSTIAFTGGSMAAGANSCSINVSVTASAAGSYINNSTNISNVSTGMDASGVSAALDVGSASLTKVFSDSPVAAGSTIDLRFTLTNRSGNPAQSGIGFTDTFPPGLVIASATTSFGAGCSGTLTNLSGAALAANATGVRLTAGAMTAGTASCNITVSVRSALAGTYINNAANISGASNGLVISGVNSTAIFTGPVLAVTKTTSSPNVYLVGSSDGLATYAITVRNSGNVDNPAAGVLISDALPSGFTYASTLGVTLTGGATRSGPTNPAVGSGTPSWGTFAMPGGSEVTITFTAAVANSTASGTYQNSASVTSTTAGSNITNYAGASSTADDVSVARLADLVIAKAQITANPVLQSQTGVQYTLTASNAGGADKAADNPVTVVDTPSAALTITAMSGSGWSCVVATATCTRTDVLTAASAYPAITVTGTVAANAPASFVNASSVAITGQTESNTSNNIGNAPATQVVALPDLAITKSHAGNFLQGQVGAQYTLVVSSNATSGVISSGPIVVTDTLPSGMTATAISGTNWSCTLATLSCAYTGSYPLVAGAQLPPITLTVTVASNAALTLTNTANVSTLVGETAIANNTANDATTIVAVGVTVSGNVYADANHNAALDAAETGSGLALYVKLVPSTASTCNGPATALATVTPGTGAYSLASVAAGTYCLVLDINNTVADVTPNLPAGWLNTETTSGIRQITVGGVPLALQNFGLYNGSVLTGRVFADTGVGAGTANDGVQNGTELGQASATIKVTNSTGATTYDTALSDGAGNYTLWIPASAGNNPLRITEINAGSQVSTGGQAGTTGGSYLRSTDTTTFTHTVGSSYSGVNFADVPDNAFITNGAQTGLPGTTLFYTHTYTAGSGGTVSFSSSATSTPATPGWSEILLRDTNCNGTLDAAEAAASPLSAPIAVNAGDVVCVIHKEFIPANAAMGAQNQVTLTALFTYTNAAAALSSSQTRLDISTVGTPTSAGLSLVKSVNKVTALPGEVLIYTIAYTNNSSAALSNFKINDNTPSFTTHVSAACTGPLPANLTACAATTQPSAGASGAIEWSLTGTLAPGSTGTVQFRVTVNP